MKITIGKKLSIGAIAGLTLMVILSIVARSSLSKISKTSDTVVSLLPKVENIDQLQFTLAEALKINDFLISGDLEKRSSFELSCMVADRVIESVEEIELDSEEKAVLDKVKEGFGLLKEKSHLIFETVEVSGKSFLSPAVNKLVEEIDAVALSLVEDSEYLQELLNKKLVSAIQKGKQVKKLGIGTTTAVSIAGILFAIIGSFALTRNITRPIRALTSATRIITEGDLDKRVDIKSPDEIGQLAAAFNNMTEKICERTEDLARTNEKLQKEVAQRRCAEEELETINKELEATVEKLTLSNSELQDFTNVAAHDLKAPLRAIGTLADWISTDYSDKFDEQGKEWVKLLVGRAERMSRIIDGILQYSRVGLAEQKKEEVNLNVLLTEVIRYIAPPDDIEITIENELPLIMCEKTHMMLVFQNLLSNAVKYMDRPRGQIRIGCVEENGFWRFSVADNGPGIEEKYFEKIFKMFQTLLPRDELESTGIGLSVAKKIIELHNGKVWVESKQDQGSTFFFTLPKAGEQKEAAFVTVKAAEKVSSLIDYSAKKNLFLYKPFFPEYNKQIENASKDKGKRDSEKEIREKDKKK